MSFILDALRKSEMERQRDAAARVMRIPVARREGVRVPVWVTALIVVLAVCVVVLAGTAWRGWHKRAAVSATSAAATREKAEAAKPKSVQRPQQGAPAAQSGGKKATVAVNERPAERAAAPSRAATPKAAPARTEAGPGAGGQAAPETRPPPARPADPAALPSADELAARGVHVPPLTLQLHVYSKDPSRRFVFINGTRYREGQKTDEGPVLVSVTPQGAVLSQQGREFFLPIQ
jgi:hypothetical protein